MINPIENVDWKNIWSEPTSDYDFMDIMQSFYAYYDVLKNMGKLLSGKEKFKACQKLVNTINEDYHPTHFGQWVHDLAYEFDLIMDFWDESPPYNSIQAPRYEDRAVNFAKAKLLNLYRVAVNRLTHYSNMLNNEDINLVEEPEENNSKTFEIKEFINIGGLNGYKNEETREDAYREYNNRLRKYVKMAKNMLTKSARERANALEGLITLIEEENSMFLINNKKTELVYIMRDTENGVEEEYSGPPDYEIYNMIINNIDELLKLKKTLEHLFHRNDDTILAESKIVMLHTALTEEKNIAEQEDQCMTKPVESPADNNNHFSKRVEDEELKAVFEGLIDDKMLCDDPSSDDFIFWHTGSGKRPNQPLKWAVKNVCRYYVLKYLESDWKTAEMCFSCKKGNIKGLSQATNITDKNINKIDTILNNAKKKNPKKNNISD